jgi:IS30 family transposase
VWIKDGFMPGIRLTLPQRAQIEVLFGQGLTAPQIAVVVGRDRSTVWRELRRNQIRKGRPPAAGAGGATHPGGRSRANPHGLDGIYRWRYHHQVAQDRADIRAQRRPARKLIPRYAQPWPALWQIVATQLRLRWSPMQISRWLRDTYPDQPELHVSHETIYQAIYYQGRGSMRQELARQVALRSGRQQRRPQSRGAAAGRGSKPWIRDLHISTRPAEVSDRAVPGHWEGDLVIGARGTSAIITLVERTSRYVMLGALPESRISEHVVDVLTTLMRRLPTELRKTLTWDQGSEMAEHATFTLATDTRVFFCDPHSPWQRGSNENTNGLLRQYFPRSSTDFRTYTQTDLDTIARELNGRPRQTLNWRNPAEALNEHLVATAV